MSTTRLIRLALLSIVTISINELPLVPIGFIIALPIVARSHVGQSLWAGIRYNWTRVLTCLAGLLVGMVVIQASCNVQIDEGFVFGPVVRFFPISDWVSASTAPSMEELYNQGQALKAQNRCQEALRYFEEAAKLRPADPDPHSKICFCYLVLNQPQYAEKACLHALERAPQDREVLQNLAASYLLQEEFSEAEVWARKALKVAPESLETLNVLAVALAAQKDSGAEQIMKELVERAPDKFLYQKNYVNFLAENDRCEEAWAQFQKATELSEDTSELKQSISEDCETIEAEHKKDPSK